MMVYEGNTWAIVLLRRHLLSQPFSLSPLRRVKVPYLLDSILKESCFVSPPHLILESQSLIVALLLFFSSHPALSD